MLKAFYHKIFCLFIINPVQNCVFLGHKTSPIFYEEISWKSWAAFGDSDYEKQMWLSWIWVIDYKHSSLNFLEGEK